MDANERYDPPRCMEGTRRSVMRKLEHWIHRDNGREGNPSSIFWLFGGVGAGKSAIAQTLAEKFKQKEDLAAGFFFFKPDGNRNDGNRLIPTLVYELIHAFPALTPLVEEKIFQNPDLFKKTRQKQMLDLLVDPLSKLKKTGVQTLLPRLIVIDALDECSDPDTQCDLLRIIASAVPSIPYPLRFLITSRSESHIMRVFEHDLRTAARFNLSDDSNSDEDIQTFLEAEFANIRRTHPLRQYLPSRWPSLESIRPIVERASGHFIYASTVIRFIQSPHHRPDDRLQVILGLRQPYEKDRPYARLDLLYRLIFLEIQDRDQLELIYRALGIMHLRSLKSGLLGSPKWISDRHAIETLLYFRPGDLRLVFDGLLSLISLEKGNIRILHKSLFDYLLDPSRSEDLQLDLGLAHGTVSNYILKHVNLHDNWSMSPSPPLR